MKTATCGAACHTQQGHPESLLGKVLYWINQPLLFLNQYCETIKGSRDSMHTQKPAAEVERSAGSAPWKYRFWFRSKENSWSGNNRTFQKNTAVPLSLPAALTPSFDCLSVCLSLSLWLEYCFCLSFCSCTQHTVLRAWLTGAMYGVIVLILMEGNTQWHYLRCSL